MPLVARSIGRPTGLDEAPLGVAVLPVAAPMATALYILARPLGSDAPLTAAVVVATMLGALVTLRIILSLPF